MRESMTVIKALGFLLTVALAVVGTASCGASSSAELTTGNSSSDTVDDHDNSPNRSPNDLVFTRKMMKSTDENRFSALGYECNTCTFEQWLSIVPPEGWSKGQAQVLIV